MSTLSERLTRTLGGDWHGDYGNVPTPGHSKSDRGTTVRQGSDPDDVVVNNFNGMNELEIKRLWREQGLLPPLQNGRTSQNKSYTAKPKPSAVPNGSEKKAKRNSDYMLRTWEGTQLIKETRGERYLDGRGLVPPYPEDIRFHSKLWNKERGGDLPALVVAVRPSPDGPIQAIQRIFLDADGQKADLAKPKMALGDLKGGGFWVPGDGGTFLVTEGPEDALSVNIATRLPTVSAISGSNMKNLKFPPGTLRVIICADHGDGGRKFARAAGELFANAGLDVLVALTAASSKDWNNVLQDERGGALAIKEAIDAAITVPEFKAQENAATSHTLICLKASEVEVKRINWLWKGKIARGKLTIFAGLPGVAKTTTAINFIATVTTGGKFPDGSDFPDPANAIIVSAEDDIEDTLVPRLEAAGADLERVHFIVAVRAGDEGQRAFNLKDDLKNLEALLDEIGDVAVILFDPISAYLGDTHSHRDAELRALLHPVAAIAAQHDVAVIGVTHFNKGGGGGKALLRVLGSIAMVAAARAAYAFIDDKDDSSRRLFLPLKNNIGIDKDGYCYAVESVDLGDGIETSKVVWDPKPVTISADEALADEPPEAQGDKTEIEHFLTSELDHGPVPTLEIFERGEALGFSKKQLNTAKYRLGVKSHKDSMDGGWSWHLSTGPASEDSPEGSQGSQQFPWEPSGTFGANGTLRGGNDDLSTNVYRRATRGD